MTFIARLPRNTRAATIAEYGLIASLVAMAAIGAIHTSAAQVGSGPAHKVEKARQDKTDAHGKIRHVSPASAPVSN